MTALDTDLDQLATDYREQGFVLVKGLISKQEAAEYREISHRLVANQAENPTWGSATEVAMGKQTSLQHLHDTQFYDAAFARLLVDARFTRVAAAVMGGPNVQLHHTKLFVKPPENGSPFPPHQDHPFFPHERHTVGAAIFHFDDAPEEKGCVRVIPGSHRAGPLEHDPEGSFHLPQIPFEDTIAQPAEAGDVLFFTYLTVHSSGVNVSDEARTTWLVQYRDPADRVIDHAHTHSLGQGMMLAGSDPTMRQD
ncbi:phytanoyl-CoA dioxygenase family protein [Ruania halotolerans]|uniref:phytanoyl-CoA dioxygenase family protein n=1 Tax=Ruania halotolerans TaxID=2897773 RepID=UPI001E641910|nr:phytanoyl-CoA dioxygenase family protein [Ruania halotolerans]UFU08290.1 phytanoyl-CoA dioxygenase family protein [Ruania halotolerans]